MCKLLNVNSLIIGYFDQNWYMRMRISISFFYIHTHCFITFWNVILIFCLLFKKGKVNQNDLMFEMIEFHTFFSGVVDEIKL